MNHLTFSAAEKQMEIPEKAFAFCFRGGLGNAARWNPAAKIKFDPIRCMPFLMNRALLRRIAAPFAKIRKSSFCPPSLGPLLWL